MKVSSNHNAPERRCEGQVTIRTKAGIDPQNLDKRADQQPGADQQHLLIAICATISAVRSRYRTRAAVERPMPLASSANTRAAARSRAKRSEPPRRLDSDQLDDRRQRQEQPPRQPTRPP